MTFSPNVLLTLLTLSLSLAAPHAQAEKADREKPIQIEAQKITIDDAKKIQILEGNVILTKGTLVIHADRILITEDQYGFQKGTAFGGAGGLARFRQKREGKEEYIDGEAERIEYNTSNEVAELFHRAWVKSGDDHIRGDYIWYDAVSEKYLVTVGDPSSPKATPSRVRAIIQPKNKNAPPPAAPTPKGDKLQLQGTQSLGTAPPSGPGIPNLGEKKP